MDLAFCRFLLTHLPEPIAALTAWRPSLRPGGALVLEELERLRSPDPVLSLYYEIIEGVQKSHGQEMFIGGRLRQYVEEAGFVVVEAKPVDAGVTAAAMASLHAPNLENVRRDPWVQERFGNDEIDELAAGLQGIAEEPAGSTAIENVLREVIATPATRSSG